ncbi:MAG: hypothetical protein HQL51_12520 [Magnetococcales bacterium]|nr:hypothetical protein [Magnetococcales bacterium]
MRIEYNYDHTPTLRAFSRDNHFLRGLMGPFGSGKSSGCVMEILRRAQRQQPGPDGIRRSRWAVIRNTYPQLQDTTIKTFFQWVPPVHFGKYAQTRQVYLVNGFPGVELEILFRALDRPDHVRNLLSLELTGAWINEAREVPREILHGLTGRVGRYPAKVAGGATWHGIIMDSNPPDTDHWWYHLFEEEKPANAVLFKQPSGLSPQAENLANLPRQYYDNLRHGKDEVWVQVYVHGEYGMVREGMPVYPGYRDNLHCREVEPMPHQTLYRGWDFGLTPACVFVQMSLTGQVRVLDELCAVRSGIERFSEEVLAFTTSRFPGYAVEDVGDPAGATPSQTDERSCYDILQAKGIDIQPGVQTLTMRLESVRKGLSTLIDGEAGLVVDPRARMIRKGFQGAYRFRRLLTREDRFTDQPEKNAYSHPHDALQYVAAHLLGEGLRGMEPEPQQRFARWGYEPFGG